MVSDDPDKSSNDNNDTNTEATGMLVRQKELTRYWCCGNICDPQALCSHGEW